MPSYQVELKPSARKELERLPHSVISRSQLESLMTDPRPPGCRKLKGGEREWRIRVGEYRAIYTIDDAASLVQVTRIRHRSSVYE